MKVTVGEVATSAGDGRSHGIVVGEGASPDLAITSMKSNAETKALPVVGSRVGALLPYQLRSKETGHWNLDFGIYDTRLVVTPTSEWVAYGTLLETGTVSLKTPPRRGYR